MTTDIEKQTLATMNDHIQTLFQDSIDEIMKNYTEGSMLFTQGGLYRGPAEIRTYYQEFLRTKPPGIKKTFKILRQDMDGEVIYITWKAEPYIHWATDTFVVRNSKIMVQTFGAYMPVSEGLEGLAKLLHLHGSEHSPEGSDA